DVLIGPRPNIIERVFQEFCRCIPIIFILTLVLLRKARFLLVILETSEFPEEFNSNLTIYRRKNIKKIINGTNIRSIIVQCFQHITRHIPKLFTSDLFGSLNSIQIGIETSIKLLDVHD